MSRKEALKAKFAELKPEGREVRKILREADSKGRPLTADEQSRVDGFLAKVKPIADALDQVNAEEETLRRVKELGPLVDPREHYLGSGAKDGHIAFSGPHRKALARKVIGASDVKALLASGSRSTGVVMLDEVFEQGRPPQSILDVLPARVVDPNYSFLQQTTRTNNAAPVAEGDTKPTSVYTLTENAARLQVIAHLSEQIPHHALGDNVNLEHFIDSEMLHGLQVAVENQVVNGTGTAPALRGILATSGIQTQAFATDILTSIRKGITKLEGQGLSADVLVISAADWEAVELLAATNGATDVRGVPIDATARRLWGVQAVVSTVLPVKTAILLDGTAVSVDHDGQIDTRWSDAVSDDFAKNYLRCRVEGRFGLSVYRPLGVVSVATAA